MMYQAPTFDLPRWAPQEVGLPNLEKVALQAEKDFGHAKTSVVGLRTIQWVGHDHRVLLRPVFLAKTTQGGHFDDFDGL